MKQELTLTIWRHPKPHHVALRCIGQTDVGVDPRRAKNLAHRIRQHARASGAPQVVFTSPLQRCAQVGRWLKRWGWQHHIDPLLSELNFGTWDGKPWAHIDKADIDKWCANFAHHAPGGGESVAALLKRCQQFMAQHGLQTHHVVGHAGWINAALWCTGHGACALPSVEQWPQPIGYLRHVEVCPHLFNRRLFRRA